MAVIVKLATYRAERAAHGPDLAQLYADWLRASCALWLAWLRLYGRN